MFYSLLMSQRVSERRHFKKKEAGIKKAAEKQKNFGNRCLSALCSTGRFG